MIIFRLLNHLHISLVGIFGIVVGAIGTLIVVALVASSTPVEIVEIRPDVSLTAHDSVLEMHFKFFKRHECNSIASSWLWQWTGGDGTTERRQYFVPIGTSFVTLANPSPLIQDFTIARPLPPGVTPGQWFLRTKYLDYCRILSPVFGPTVRQTKDQIVDVPKLVTR